MTNFGKIAVITFATVGLVAASATLVGTLLARLTVLEFVQILALGAGVLSAAVVLALLFSRRSAREAQRLREALSGATEKRIAMEIALGDAQAGGSNDDMSPGEPHGAEDAADLASPPVPPGLAESIAHGSAILVVGSAPSVREQAPTWKAFLGTLIGSAATGGREGGTAAGSESSGLQRLLERNELDAVVDLLEEMIGRDALAGSAREAFGNASPSPWLERLCRLGWSGFVSTGVDDSMKRAARAAHVVTARSAADFEQFVRSPERFLLQLAGDLAQPGTLSLTMAQLKETLAAAPDLRSLLLSILHARTVLFVGMTFREIENLWDAVGMHGPSPGVHYALVEVEPDFDLIADRARSRYNVELLGAGDPAVLTGFAHDLGVEVQASARAIRAGEGDGSAQVDFVSDVKLVNIGPFSRAQVPLGPGWNVILGNNGAGKSTLLRAIALVLAGTDAEARAYARSLLRRGQKSGLIEITIDTVPQPSTYRAQLSLEGDRVNLTTSVSPLQAGRITAFGFSAVRGLSVSHMTEPETVRAQPLPRVSDILPLLQGGLDGRAQDLRAWIRQNYAVHQDSALPEPERRRARAKIDSFFRIVDDMAPGFELSFSRCDPLSGEILLRTSDGEIPLDYVSQGMSSMIGWAGTLIQRLFEINGDEANPTDAHAVLLIDEIDSHLHPEWQQRLVPTLREKFPNLQVIATTHSALMVGSLEEQEVVKVSRDKAGLHVERLEKSYKGYRVDQILTDDAFDLPSARDQGWEALRREYAVLLGKSNRTEEEERRYLALDEMLESAPPPFEARADRESYEDSRARLNETIAAGDAPVPGEAPDDQD